MLVTPEKFCRVGEALFGPRWRGVLAQMMAINNRMVSYYGDGTYSIPPALITKLATICRARGEALIRIADDLER